MVTRKFTLYDLLADIVPGAVAIVFSFVFYGVPQVSTLSKSTLIAGTAFFVLAYFIGRLIHSVGSIISPYLRKINVITINIERDDSFPFISLLGEDTPEFRIRKLIKESSSRSNIDDDKLPEDISAKVLEDLDRSFRRELGTSYKAEQAKRFGEALLYPKTALYSKYESIVTFFRSIFLMPFILLVGYVILNLYGYISHTKLTQWEYLAFWLLVFTIPLSIYAGRKFWKARNVAFVNDLYITLTRDTDE